MTPENLRSLWVGSGQLNLFISLFGTVRGRELADKFSHHDLITFLCKECNDDEIEKLLKFCVK